jgi:hypothetical protein
VPSIDIYDKPCGLDLLFTAYKALLPKMGGHITGVSLFADVTNRWCCHNVLSLVATQGLLCFMASVFVLLVMLCRPNCMLDQFEHACLNVASHRHYAAAGS